MSFIEFKSLKELKQLRELERESKDDILKKAKESYERKQWKEAIAKQKGEDTWMLPSVNTKIDEVEKKEKKRKSKKSKKDKKGRKDSSGNESNDEEDIWVEKKLPHSQQSDSVASSKRDQWMEAPSLFKTYSREEMQLREGTHRGLKKLEERKRKEDANKPGSHARELNPYYQDGGVGLPERDATHSITSSKNFTYDAGWLKKALNRAQNQAKEEGKSLEEIAKTRWGSLDAFYVLLREAENNSLPQEAKSGTEKYSKYIKHTTLSKDGRECFRYENDVSDRHNNRYKDKRNSRDKIRSGSDEKSYSYKDRIRSPEREKTKKKRSHSSSSDDSSNSSNSSNGHRRKDTTKTFDCVKTMTSLKTRDALEKSSSKPSGSFLKPGDKLHKRTALLPTLSSSNQGNWKKKGIATMSTDSYTKYCDNLELPSEKRLESLYEKLPEKVVEKEKIIGNKKDDGKILNDKEMNQLAAKLTKAELLGNEVSYVHVINYCEPNIKNNIIIRE